MTTGSPRTSSPAARTPRRSSARLLAAAVAVAATLTACAQPHVKQYQAGVEANVRNFETIRLGMTREQVEERMGDAHAVNYKRVQLRNPWRTEAFRVSKTLQVDILYYVTQGYVWQGFDDRHALTPVIFENDVVVGWGWGFLDRNRDRYIIKDVPLSPPAAK